MSFALTAASFESLDNMNSPENQKGLDNVPYSEKLQNSKQNGRRGNRTVKNRNALTGSDETTPKQHSDKLNQALKEIHSKNNTENSAENSGTEGLANFEPLGPPVSMGSTNRAENEQNQANNLPGPVQQHGGANSFDEAFSPEQYAQISQAATSEYANQYVPYFANASDNQGVQGEHSTLMEKLNYVIHMLEEQKDEKTNHITEEVVLYCFLGVFVIFVTDSFARAGKYSR